MAACYFFHISGMKPWEVGQEAEMWSSYVWSRESRIEGEWNKKATRTVQNQILPKQIEEVPQCWPCPNKLSGPFPCYSAGVGSQLAHGKTASQQCNCSVGQTVKYEGRKRGRTCTSRKDQTHIV